jgi:two-component system response regulator RstA
VEGKPLTDQKPRLLVVEDDARLATLVQEYLEQQNFCVVVERRGDTALERVTKEEFDCILLDIMLPGMDGLEVCRRARATYSGPILMLTARGDEIDEIVGLESGADDYLPKPLQPRRLLARVRALLRGSQLRGTATSDGEPSGADDSGDLVIGALVISPANRRVVFNEQELRLTTTEFDVLEILGRQAGRAVSREELHERIHSLPYDGLDRSIDLTVGRLRKKLGDDGRQPRIIKSVRATGYQLVGDP